MKKQDDYIIIQCEGTFMVDSLANKVKELQLEGWICQGGVVINKRDCYQAMVKEKEILEEESRRDKNDRK